MDTQLHMKLISAFHCSALGGHSGFSVTYKKMKQIHACKGMKVTVKEFVQTCLVCQ
jgi:hypothetical protein